MTDKEPIFNVSFLLPRINYGPNQDAGWTRPLSFSVQLFNLLQLITSLINYLEQPERRWRNENVRVEVFFKVIHHSSLTNWRQNRSEASEGFIYLTCSAMCSCDKVSGIPVTQKVCWEKSNDYFFFLSVLLSRAMGVPKINVAIDP